MKSVKILLACLVTILVFSSLVNAEVPKMINYQGKITTPQGALISDTFSMVFSIYADSTGGTPLWTETQSSVKVEFGVFSVLLGSVSPIPATVFDGNTRYLGLKVGSDNEMTPRKAIVSVGYAYHSGTADTAHFAMPDSDWTIQGDTIYHLNGNVGIGTTSPGEKLEVNGNMKISGTIVQDSWTAPTLLSGWADYGGDYGPAGYFRDKEGIVHLRGVVTGSLGTVIFVLPVGYRPAYTEIHVVHTEIGIGICDIRANGQVAAEYTGSDMWFSLDGISFKATGY